MNTRELMILAGLCFAWGFHFVVVKTAVSALPPIFYAAIRMSVVAIVLAAFLRWRPGSMGRIFAAALCLGCLNYAFMFTGLKFATASTGAISLNLFVPFVTILSIIFLKDRIAWRRLLGIGLAFLGVVVIALGAPADASPHANIPLGVGLIACSAFVESIGAILVKTSTDFKPHELLAWFSFVGSIVLWGLTGLLEEGQFAAIAANDNKMIIGAVLYSALIASVFGHTAYYWLMQRLPMTIIAPSTLLVTVIAVLFGVLLLDDRMNIYTYIGGFLTLLGVGIVLFRTISKDNKVAAKKVPGKIS